MHIGLFFDMRGNIILQVSMSRIFMYYIYSFNLVSPYANEKAL